MDGRSYYLENVYPQLDLPLRQAYPLAQLEDGLGYHPLGEQELLMLVALTGTGKSTTLSCFCDIYGGAGMGLIPSRRELADWIAIPMLQTMQSEMLHSVSDRVRRFRYTRSFAEEVRGGMAAAFFLVARGGQLQLSADIGGDPWRK